MYVYLYSYINSICFEGENVERLFRRIAAITFCEVITKEIAEKDDVQVSDNFVSK